MAESQFAQEPMFTEGPEERLVMVLQTAYGPVAVDGDWYVSEILCRSDWQVPWQAMLEQLQVAASQGWTPGARIPIDYPFPGL